jgi:hypothetical protein
VKAEEYSIQLAPDELQLYQEAVEAEGVPRFLHDEDRPNAALQAMWDLRKEHGFIFRLRTAIDENGLMTYDCSIPQTSG